MNIVSRLLKTLPARGSLLQPVATMGSNSPAMFVFPDGRKMRVPLLPPEIAARYKPGQMFTNQASLPSLPVNPLEQSLSKYLQAVEPIVPPEDLARTRAIIEDFKKPGGVGEKLQQMLLDRASKMDSWLIDWWNKVAYLAFRDPVIVNVTPAITFPFLDCSTRQAHVETATKLIMGMLKFYQLVQIEAIPPDTYRGKPYCMWQYPRLYGCRIPGENIDSFSNQKLPENRHVIIMRKGNPYKLTIFYDTDDGEVVMAPPTFIMDQLHWILEDAKERPLHPPGVLTATHRDNWFKAREELKKDPTNRATINDIESSVMMFCLDEAKPDLNEYKKASEDPSFGNYEGILAERMLHGNGADYNTINRWYDCITQIVVGEDGGCGSVLEHSSADGVVGVFTTKFTLDLMLDYKYDFLGETSLANEGSLKPAQRLEWNLSEKSVLDIQDGCKDVNKLISNVDFHVSRFNSFGQSLMKSHKLSPDGFMQMAIQLAYYKVYGRSAATYESGGTRWFKKGRTDTIRSATNASHAFVKGMTDPTTSNTRKRELMVAAIKAHSDYTIETVSGRAFDRHLLGLRLLASEAGMPMPELFNDPTYQKSLHFHLSTSQVPVPNHDIFLSFGAVVPDGYGVCYNPQMEKFLISVSSYFDAPSTDSKLLAAKLEESMLEMRDALLAATPPASKL